ncbi:translation initiation factor IF-2-like [Psammomys obesus]|uniref:translation initiation factor IF-2-like n=1 Tax=Psammomys obesus TaxID=48139 RepID=UPI0024528E65|nr:translation initiation factor IF-2-like [Psammomys obesus]
MNWMNRSHVNPRRPWHRRAAVRSPAEASSLQESRPAEEEPAHCAKPGNQPVPPQCPPRGLGAICVLRIGSREGRRNENTAQDRVSRAQLGKRLNPGVRRRRLLGREEGTNERAWGRSGKRGQEAGPANGRRGRVSVRVRIGGPGAAGGRLGEGASWIAAELLPPPQPPPQRRGHVVWCVGRGEEEEGVKPSEETGETPHTAQDGRRGSSNPSCQAACRGPRARCCAGSSPGTSRRAPGERGGRGRGEAAVRGCGSPRPRRPRRPGPRRPGLRCGSAGAGGARGREAARAVGGRLRRAPRPRGAGKSEPMAPAAALRPGNFQDYN